MIVCGTSTTWTVRGTTVPTLTEKLTLLTRGALEAFTTSLRIVVRCSVVRLTDPDEAAPTVEPDFAPSLSWLICDLLSDGDCAWLDFWLSLPIWPLCDCVDFCVSLPIWPLC